MTFMPDAHRPKAEGPAGCWAGGNFACDAPATEPLGLCDRHRVEITSGDRRENLEPDPHRQMSAVEAADRLERLVSWATGDMRGGSRATMWIADELPEDEGERVFGWPDMQVDLSAWSLDQDNAMELSDMPDSWPAEPWEDA